VRAWRFFWNEMCPLLGVVYLADLAHEYLGPGLAFPATFALIALIAWAQGERRRDVAPGAHD